MITTGESEEVLQHLSNGIICATELPAILTFLYNGDTFATARENNDNFYVRFYWTRGNSVYKMPTRGFFIQKNKMYEVQGRDKCILSAMSMQMNTCNELDQKLKTAFHDFVEKYFEHLHKNKRTEAEAD